MLRESKRWDVRGGPELARMFPRAKRRGYWYRVDRSTAQRVVEVLASCYGIPAPTINSEHPGENRGLYTPWEQSITLHARAHLKTVFHEFYHHLDHMTRGKYNSSDRLRHGHIFADVLWGLFRGEMPDVASITKAWQSNRQF